VNGSESRAPDDDVAGFLTITSADPAAASAGTFPDKAVEDNTDVAMVWPRKTMTEPATKFVPVTCIVCPGPALPGVIDVIAGAKGLLTLKWAGGDVPPPGGRFVTVISITPTWPSKDAGIVIVREVDELKNVASF
jgi:hypothetical protein